MEAETITQSEVSTTGQKTQPGPLPEGFDLGKLFEGVHWHQRWEVFEGVFTPGRNPVRELCDLAGLPEDLRGQRVLDIGAWNGGFTFECERRGADQVIAVSLEDPDETGFNRLREAVGSKVVRYVRQSVYTLDPKALGQFDLILFLGVLYHLRYPLVAVDRIRNVCRGTTLIETHTIDEYFLTRNADGDGVAPLEQAYPGLGRVPLWRFYKDDELLKDSSNWFGPNIQAVIEAFDSAGFCTRLHRQWGDRASFIAEVKKDLVTSLDHTYETYSSDNLQFMGVELN